MCKNLKDLTGLTFGKLTVIEKGPNRIMPSMTIDRWYCKCACDPHKEPTLVDGRSLLSGNSKSCNCVWKLKSGNKSQNWKGFGEIPRTRWNHIKAHCAKEFRGKEIEFDITIEYAWELFVQQNKKCALSGKDLTFKNSKDNWCGNASLDRKDSSVGYVKGNVQWVYKPINKIKQTLTNEQFIEWCHLISQHNKGQI